ncbi:cytosolic sulfotransferase 16-like [Solanum tuberosum]|uniref:cytosolic sulfotransferase 16-like n=1 Tax=Solanum tuberosum TaxID=4113 RepID=UPI00073A2EA0|nr:PREDICTED: cytosolic sulfotransferase 16-like [Solanum tuberosum]
MISTLCSCTSRRLLMSARCSLGCSSEKRAEEGATALVVSPVERKREREGNAGCWPQLLEPKDAFVSSWHFTHKIEAKNLEVPLITLDQALKWFCQGKSVFGPYWDHVLGYWKASVEKPDRVFFFKYEDLKEDTLGYVKKLAEFMDKPFSKEEQERGVPQEIVARCNFENLSNLEVNKSGMLLSERTLQISNSVFYRKGEVGDWKNYLTDDMAKLIDDITHDKFQSSGLTFPSSSACN